MPLKTEAWDGEISLWWSFNSRVNASTPIDAQYKLQQLWEASLKALNSNAQVMVQTNAKLMQDWLEFMKKNIDGAAKASAASASK